MASEVMASTRASRWAEIACERRLLREGPLLLRQVVMIPRRRQTYRRRLLRPMWPLLQRCECLRAGSFSDE
jgi:hypothetical protein